MGRICHRIGPDTSLLYVLSSSLITQMGIIDDTAGGKMRRVFDLMQDSGCFSRILCEITECIDHIEQTEGSTAQCVCVVTQSRCADIIASGIDDEAPVVCFSHGRLDLSEKLSSYAGGIERGAGKCGRDKIDAFIGKQLRKVARSKVGVYQIKIGDSNAQAVGRGGEGSIDRQIRFTYTVMAAEDTDGHAVK